MPIFKPVITSADGTTDLESTVSHSEATKRREEFLRKRQMEREERKLKENARREAAIANRKAATPPSRPIEEIRAERKRLQDERRAAEELKRAERRAKISRPAEDRTHQKATRPPKARDKSAADYPCSFRGQIEGRLICNCRNKPDVYQCSAEFNAAKLCIAAPMSQTIDGPLVRGGKKSTEHYLPWQVEESEPRGKPMGDLIRVPVCSLCPHRDKPPTVLELPPPPPTEILNPEARIVVVTAYTPHGEWKEIGAITSRTMREYCQKHGYAFRCHTDGFETDIHPSWSKVKFLRQALEHHETALWLDADAMITNPLYKIEDLPTGDFLASTDNVDINCGVLLLRKSQFTNWLLNELWNCRYERNRLWEQETIKRLFYQGRLTGLKVLPPRTLNSRLPVQGDSEWHDWKFGDFIAHAYRTKLDIGLKLSELRRVGEDITNAVH